MWSAPNARASTSWRLRGRDMALQPAVLCSCRWPYCGGEALSILIQRYSEGTALFVIFSHIFQGFLREFLPWSGSSCRHVRRSTSCLGLWYKVSQIDCALQKSYAQHGREQGCAILNYTPISYSLFPKYPAYADHFRQSRHFPKRRLTTHPSHLRQDQRDNRRDKQTALPCLRRKVKETTPPIHVLLATKAQARARPSGRAADVTRSLLRMNIDINVYIYFIVIYNIIICNYKYIYVYWLFHTSKPGQNVGIRSKVSGLSHQWWAFICSGQRWWKMSRRSSGVPRLCADCPWSEYQAWAETLVICVWV